MRTVNASAPNGEQWQVQVQWMPRWQALARKFGGWRRRRREKKSGGIDGFDVPDLGGGDEFLAVVAVIIGMILFGVLFWFLLLPLALLLIDVVIVTILLVVGVVARVVLRRPWHVVAHRDPAPGGAEHPAEPVVAYVVGWRRALRTRDEMAEQIRRGQDPRPVASPVMLG